ncbi:hypothetical protein HK096_007256, partial [Nowakowskiella sp. JEL0078]
MQIYVLKSVAFNLTFKEQIESKKTLQANLSSILSNIIATTTTSKSHIPKITSTDPFPFKIISTANSTDLAS